MVSPNENVMYVTPGFEVDEFIKVITVSPFCLICDKPDLFHPTLPNIYIQVEPEAIFPIASYLLHNHHRYHMIFTFHEDVLRGCTNARKYTFGTTWLPSTYYLFIDPSMKKFQISHLAGGKQYGIRGHMLRQEIHHHQHLFQHLPLVFYRSSQQSEIKDYGNNPLLGGSKAELFQTFQFAIIIENSKQQNYFTEKIIDCLLSKTIPIYWGCPNIGDYFDTSGWIVIEDDGDVYSIVQSLDQLDPLYYHRFWDTIETNHARAQKYLRPAPSPNQPMRNSSLT